MLIILSGLPGAGKTSIARALARETAALHLRIDSIESAILDSAIAPASIEDAGYRAAYAVATDNLRLGRTVVADSVNPVELTREAWRTAARAAGVAAIEVEIVCSDAAEHRRRVEARVPDIAGRPGPTWTDIVTREYEPWPRERIVIDTAAVSPERGVDAILAAMAAARNTQLLVITGTMGAGKSVVMAEASDLLTAARIRHGAIDFDALAIGLPADAVAYQNLRSAADNFVARGVSTLLVAAAVENSAALRRLCAAVSAPAATVCRLRAPVAAMEERVRRREPGMYQRQFVARVAVLERTLDRAALEDFSVVNDGRPVTDVARDMLVRVGWLASL